MRGAGLVPRAARLVLALEQGAGSTRGLHLLSLEACGRGALNRVPAAAVGGRVGSGGGAVAAAPGQHRCCDAWPAAGVGCAVPPPVHRRGASTTSGDTPGSGGSGDAPLSRAASSGGGAAAHAGSPHEAVAESAGRRARRRPSILGAAGGPQQLKVRLRDDADAGEAATAAAEADAVPLDLFSLSRTLGAGAEQEEQPAAGAGEQQRGARRALGPDEQRTLSKLVGCLTKEGKRSRAQRVLSDALQVINAQLRRKGGG